MRTPPLLPRFLAAALASAALASAAFPAAASPVYSPVVGFVRFDCPGGSDTVVSVPFHPAPRWAGRLASAPADQGGAVFRLTLLGTPDFAPGELTDAPHLLFCRDGSGAEGRHFPVAAHGAGTVDIAAEAADLAGLAEDDPVSVLPAWTLDTLFPPGEQTAFHLSAGNLASQRGSEALLFDRSTAGVGLAPARRFFLTAAGWVEAGGYAPADGLVIEPGQPFIIRHRPGAAATAFTPLQQVYGDKLALAVRVTQGKAQDTALGPARPVPVALADLDLGPGVFEESPSTDPGDRRDELRVFDNAVPGQNKAPAAVYFRAGGQWVADAPGFPPADLVEIEPAAGLILRKAAATEDGAVLWVNAPRYDLTAP